MSDRTGPFLTRIRAFLRYKGIDSFLVTDITNVRYISGFSGSSGFLFISGKENFFVSDFRYKEQSEKEVAGWEIVLEKGTRINVIKHLSLRTKTRKLGFESSASYSFYRSLSRTGFNLTPVKGLIEKMREQKDTHELAAIREAIRRAETAFLEVKPYIKAGIRENALALRLEERLKKNGCRTIPFDIIVASGPNAALPHAKPTDRKLERGDCVLIDWGGEANGYLSDMTRTLIIKGNAISKQERIYTIVWEANRKAIVSVAPEIQSRQIDKAARDHIKQSGYGNLFGHGTGHGVGLQVHEAPRITWSSSVTVKKNMVFTIEPGIYLPGVGGVRIEDMIHVGDEKAEVLTSLNKELEII